MACGLHHRLQHLGGCRACAAAGGHPCSLCNGDPDGVRWHHTLISHCGDYHNRHHLSGPAGHGNCDGDGPSGRPATGLGHRATDAYVDRRTACIHNPSRLRHDAAHSYGDGACAAHRHTDACTDAATYANDNGDRAINGHGHARVDATAGAGPWTDADCNTAGNSDCDAYTSIRRHQHTASRLTQPHQHAYIHGDAQAVADADGWDAA